MNVWWTVKPTRAVLSTILLASTSLGVASCSDENGDVDSVQGAITGGWTSLALINNWQNYNSSSYLPAVGVVNGIVTFRGAIKASSPLSAVPFAFANSTFANFRTSDGNGVTMRTVMFQPSVGNVGGSVQYMDNFMENGYKAAVYQDPRSETIIGAGAKFYTSLEGVAYDKAVGTGIPSESHWGSVYGLRQNVSTCPGIDCGVWVKKTSDGFIRFQGALISSDSNNFDGYLFRLTDSQYIPGQMVMVPADLGGGQSWGALTFYPDGAVYVNGNPPAANHGVSFENVWFSKTNAGNQGVTLSNGWQAHNAVRTPKVGMYGGVVRFQGAIKGGTSASIGSLPQTSYRPVSQIRLMAVANGPVPATIVIDTNGNISLQGVPVNVASLYLSLDGLSYAL